MFVQIAGERFRVLLREHGGAWVISCEEYQMPMYIDQNELDRAGEDLTSTGVCQEHGKAQDRGTAAAL